MQIPPESASKIFLPDVLMYQILVKKQINFQNTFSIQKIYKKCLYLNPEEVSQKSVGDGSKFIGYPGRDYRQGAKTFFRK